MQIFQCRQLQADHIKAKDLLEVRQLQTQRAILHTAESKELNAQAIQTDTLMVDDQMHATHMSAQTAVMDSLEIKTKLNTPHVTTQHVQSFSMESSNAKTKNMECSEKCTAMKLAAKQLDITKQATIEEVAVKKTLNVHGLSTLDTTQCMGALSTHDQVRHNGSVVLADRLEADVGRPIQVKQAIQFHRPLCESNYQYFIFNTPQQSVSKPYQISIHDESTALIIDSDVTNIWSLDIRLPANPIRGQRVTISTNPSITNVEIRGSIPVVNAVNSMSMGSFVQYLYVQEPNKWFRIG